MTRNFETYLQDMELVSIAAWIDDLVESGQDAETIANTVIEDGVVHVPGDLFDDLVEYAAQKIAARAVTA